MFDNEERPCTRRLGVCRECDELTFSVAEDANIQGQLVCRLTFNSDDETAAPPRVTLPDREGIGDDRVKRYEQRRVPRRCKRLEVYETVNKLGVL